MKKELPVTDGKVDSSGAVAEKQEMPEDEAIISFQNSALILVDIQYDFLSPHGALSVPSAPEILPTAYGLLDEGLEWKAVVASKDFHPPSHISFASTHHAQPFTKLSIPNSSSSSSSDERQVESKTIDLWPDHCVGIPLSVQANIVVFRERGISNQRMNDLLYLIPL
ncbi:hypothetical protein PGT21_024977 [Puccinia graminis f. sp. tritici]|uniref:Isochorismatase-like domain-containing protein n=1 Tax=Puccinia graminis f. sp. tritici TaxID=56615 RepID=A0A5B0R1M7_PUCGR|nr:hypothetical protein PGT21_024977 [Puccinia graminis f. sp. tritici]